MKNNIEVLHEYAKNFPECEKYHQPVIIFDESYKIIYKNSAANFVNVIPRIGITIDKYINDENFEKLQEAIKEKELKILKLDVISPINRCVIHPIDKYCTALIFFDVFNYISKNSKYENELFAEIENIIFQYNKKIRYYNNDYFSNNHKNIIYFKENFRKHIINLNPAGYDKYKRNCYIGVFLKNYITGISKYVNSFGYKIGSDIKDNMFFYKLNESDFMSVNFILSAFAFKHSVYQKIDISFKSDFYEEVAAVLRYEFGVKRDFIDDHGSVLKKDYLKETDDIEYIDLNFAALIAKNNGMGLRIDFDGDDKIYLDVLFGMNTAFGEEVKSPIGKIETEREFSDEITAEDIEERLETEFARVF